MNFLTSIPEFEAWKQGKSLEDALGSYCSYHRRLEHFLCAVPIFWPDFVIRDDLLLRKDAIPEQWDEFMESAKVANWSPTQIEYVLNHVHISDLFWNDPSYDQTDVAASDFLASTIAEMWRCRLQSLFPDRLVLVEINDEGIAPEVAAYSIRTT